MGDTLVEDTTVGVDFEVVQAEDSFEVVLDTAKISEEALGIGVEVVEDKD